MLAVLSTYNMQHSRIFLSDAFTVYFRISRVRHGDWVYIHF